MPRNPQLHDFRSLMATRRVPISDEHVRAINLVEVDFYKCGAVEAAWKEYKNHLNTASEENIWRNKRDRLLAALLFQMGKVLGFHIPEIELFQGGYAPDGWMYRDMRAGAVTDYILDLAANKKSLPMNVVGFPTDEELAKRQTAYLKILEERMRDGKAWPVEITNRENAPSPQ